MVGGLLNEGGLVGGLLNDGGLVGGLLGNNGLVGGLLGGSTGGGLLGGLLGGSSIAPVTSTVSEVADTASATASSVVEQLHTLA